VLRLRSFRAIHRFELPCALELLTLPQVSLIRCPSKTSTDIGGAFKVAEPINLVGAGFNASRGRRFVDASGQWSQNGGDHNQRIEGNAIGHSDLQLSASAY
jgi:hypothetical protein